MYQFNLNPSDKTPKHKQIINSVMADIKRNVLKKMSNCPQSLN